MQLFTDTLPPQKNILDEIKPKRAFMALSVKCKGL